MTGSSHGINWLEQVTIPVKRVGNRLEFFFGGNVPAIEGAIRELMINTASIKDKTASFAAV